MTEGSSGRVQLDDMSEGALEALLGFMYGGLEVVDPACVVELFTISDR